MTSLLSTLRRLTNHRLAAAASLGAALVTTLCVATPSAAVRAPNHTRWDWPLSPRPRVVHTFDAPDPDWRPGHRGVDLLGQLGAPVHAIGAGTVSFVGTIGGIDVVVVNHGELRSTYQPILPSVHVGEYVHLGQMLGTLETRGSHCLPGSCLHLGVLHGTRYIDPLTLFGPVPVRLLPLARNAFPPAGGTRGFSLPSSAEPGSPVSSGSYLAHPASRVGGALGALLEAHPGGGEAMRETPETR